LEWFHGLTGYNNEKIITPSGVTIEVRPALQFVGCSRNKAEYLKALLNLIQFL
jgi:hypothetical protein